jgi:competence protein ComEC
MGGMPAVLRNLRPRELWVSLDPESGAYRALLREAAELGITVRHWRAGDSPDWSGVRIDVLAPEVGYTNVGPPANNDSLVLHLQYGSASVLLEGDAEAPSERTLVTGNRLSPVTLLKVGHHGSLTSSNPAFLDAVRPRDAVISVGALNTFGHPRAEIIQRLTAEGTTLFRTDQAGATSFLLRSDGGIDVRTSASN